MTVIRPLLQMQPHRHSRITELTRERLARRTQVVLLADDDKRRGESVHLTERGECVRVAKCLLGPGEVEGELAVR